MNLTLIVPLSLIVTGIVRVSGTVFASVSVLSVTVTVSNFVPMSDSDAM
jgi:hypothetical protein